RLLVEDPFALLVGFALDQQVTVQKAFEGPLVLRERLGTLDPARVATAPISAPGGGPVRAARRLRARSAGDGAEGIRGPARAARAARDAGPGACGDGADLGSWWRTRSRCSSASRSISR